MSRAEYVAAEQASSLRHEYLNGQVYAMAGGTPEHGALAAAVMGELRAALVGKPCRVYSSDVRVSILETRLVTYPDASVVCGTLETDPADRDAVTNPILVVEVLSESTEAYDRGAKAAHYRQVPSLMEYVFLSQDEPRIEVYRRVAPGRWELREARTGERIPLESCGIELEVSAIFTNPLASS